MIGDRIAEQFINNPVELGAKYSEYLGIYYAQKLYKQYRDAIRGVYDEDGVIPNGSKSWFGNYQIVFDRRTDSDHMYYVYEDRTCDLFYHHKWIISEDFENVEMSIYSYFMKAQQKSIPKDFKELIENGLTLRDICDFITKEYFVPNDQPQESEFKSFIQRAFPDVKYMFTEMLFDYQKRTDIKDSDYDKLQPLIFDYVYEVNDFFDDKLTTDEFMDELERIYDDVIELYKDNVNRNICEEILQSISEIRGVAKYLRI